MFRMVKSFTQQIRRPMFLLIFGCLLMLTFVLAACGGDSGSSSGGSSSGGGSGTMVTIKESKGSSGSDVYTFDQTTLSVSKGASVTFQNNSDENQVINASDAGVNVTVPINGTGSATFNNAGTFTLKTNKGATMTVTVK
jgi:plastocyanin